MDDGDRPPEGRKDSGRSESPAPLLILRAEFGLDNIGFLKPFGVGDMPLLGEAPKLPSVRTRNGPGSGNARTVRISNESSIAMGFGGLALGTPTTGDGKRRLAPVCLPTGVIVLGDSPLGEALADAN